MKLSKQAFVLGVLLLSNALDLTKARDVLKTLRGMKDDSVVEHVMSKPALTLMAKMSSIFSSCEGCNETASPSPPSPPSPTSPGSSGGKPAPQARSVRVIQTGNHFMGCYLEEAGQKHRVTTDDPVKECGERCKAKYFNVIGTECQCFPIDKPPATLLDISACEFVSSDENKMDLYLNVNVDENCSAEGVAQYKEKLIQQNRRLGFDHVKNEWKDGIFQHYSSKCNTNIYQLKTAVSGDISTFTTYGSEMTEYAKETSSSISESVSGHVDVSYDAVFWSASAKVSASQDKDLNKLMKSSGSQSAESRIFYSYGVKRLVEINQNFANMKYEFMFNYLFIDALRQYKDSDFMYHKAKEIFDRYGTTVLESGFVGGFAERRAIMTGREFDNKLEDSVEAKACYQAAIEAEGSYGGFEGSGSIDESKCKSEGLEAMKASRRTMTNEQTGSRTVGGELSGSGEDAKFIVTPESAQLLTSSKMYPSGKKLKLRLLTDYLAKDKIHPWEYEYWHLLPDEFEEIHSKLQDHLYEFLIEKDSTISECTPCPGSLYLEEDTSTDPSTFNCGCYFFGLPDKKLVNPDPDIHLGESCDMSEGVAVIVGNNLNHEHVNAVMYMEGEMKKEITPVPSNSPEFSHSFELARIDKYIVFNTNFGLQIFDRSGQFKKTILNRANSDNYDSIRYIATAGDLVVATRYWKPYKLMIYSIETGEKKHEMECVSHSTPEMTTKHLVVREADNKINIYSIENNFQLAGTIPRVGSSPQSYSIFGEKIVVVGNHDGVGYGKIYDTKGSLITSLTLPTEADLKKHFGKLVSYLRNIVSMNDQFIVVGVSSVDGGKGAIYVFDSETGSYLEERRSPSPKDNEGYGSCVALSYPYMVSTGKKSYSGSSPAYFQSVYIAPSSKEIYMNSTAGTDEIMITDY